MNESPALAAVLFDVDGTLLDSRDFISGAIEHNMRLHNVDVEHARERWKTLVGRDLPFIYRDLVPHVDSTILCESHWRFQRENLHLVKMFPGIRELLVALHERKTRLAAVTSRSRGTVGETLKMHLLHDFFDLIICSEDVTNIKPHPEPVLTALQNFKVDPRSAVMVGDSRVDVEAGKAAGTKTIGVTYGFDGSAVASASPDFVVSSVSELSWLLTVSLSSH